VVRPCGHCGSTERAPNGQCPCHIAEYRRRKGGAAARDARDDTTVVTFRADRAEECVARFVEWGGAAVQDPGVLDGYRRYRVDESQWRLYTRQASSG